MALYLTDQNGKPIQIAGFGISSIEVYNGLDSFGETIALSAYQGNILNTKITDLNTNILTLADSLASYYNKNETDLLLNDKASVSDIPIKTSELQNDGDGTSSFATEQYVDNNGGKIDSISVNGIKQTIDQTKNVNIEITEYDDTEINRLIGNKVDKEEGKGLSSNDYTTEEKTKLETTNSLANSNSTQIAKFKTSTLKDSGLLDMIYPVGTGHIFFNDLNPNVVYGGTWVRVAAGKTIWTTTTAGEGGTEIAAGLPNITGSLTSNPDSNNAGLDAPASGSGAIKSIDKTGSGSDVNGTNWSVWGGFTFDASKSNSIYGNSSTVQPPAVKVYLWYRTA